MTKNKPSFKDKTLELRQAILATQKSVTVEISSGDLEQLKDSGYKLCFAKKIGDEAFNVVWQSFDQYLIRNEFSWVPMYELFGSNAFQSNVTVKVSTNVVQIGLGEQSTLSSAGILSKPVTGGPSTSFTMINSFGSIHPGVNQLSTGLDGKTISTPIYVSEKPVVQGNTDLTPVEKVLIWFEQNIETSTMFSDSRSESIELDLTFEDSTTVKYEDHKWTKI